MPPETSEDNKPADNSAANKSANDKAASDKEAADKKAAEEKAALDEGKTENATAKPGGIMGFIVMAISFLMGGLGGDGQNGKLMDGFKDFLKKMGDALGFTSQEDAAKTNAADIKQTTNIQNTGRDKSTQVNVHQLEIVEGTLSALSNVQEASRLKDANIAFLSDNNTYVASTDARAATEKSIEHVRITVDGAAHYYAKLDGVDGVNGTNTGLKASAWIETDNEGRRLKDASGKSDIHLAFGGYSGSPMDGSPQTQSLMEVVKGNLNPQSVEAAEFTDRVLKYMGGRLGEDKIGGVIFGSHSLGASNALAAQAVTDLEGIPSKTNLLIEPAGASLAKMRIQEALRNENSDLHKEMQKITGADGNAVKAAATALEQDIANNTISIRSIYTENAKENGKEVTRVYETSAASLKFGDVAKVKSQIMGLVSGQKSGLELGSGTNPNNAMIGGLQLYQNTTGINDATSDSHHQLHNLVTAEGQNKGNDYYTAQQMMAKAGVTTATDQAFNSQIAKPKAVAHQKG